MSASELPDVTPAELEAIQTLNINLLNRRIDNEVALALMNKGLVKLSRNGYALISKGISVLATIAQ